MKTAINWILIILAAPFILIKEIFVGIVNEIRWECQANKEAKKLEKALKDLDYNRTWETLKQERLQEAGEYVFNYLNGVPFKFGTPEFIDYISKMFPLEVEMKMSMVKFYAGL